jgi:hypothetical protein
MWLMKTLFGLLVASSLVGCFATVGPDGQVVGGGQASFSLVLPTILPPLVVVHPGVSVVSNMDDEVFYSDGYYWAHQDRSWYRTRDHRRGWAAVDNRYVPAPIVRSPPGQYRRYQPQPQRNDRGRDDRGRGERRDD